MILPFSITTTGACLVLWIGIRSRNGCVAGFQPRPALQRHDGRYFPRDPFEPSSSISEGSLRSQYVPLDGSEPGRQMWNGTASSKSGLPSMVDGSGSSNGQRKATLDDSSDIESLLEYVVPALSPFVAYFSYEYVAQAFNIVVELFSNNNWFAVDGGQLEAKVIAPAINGIVVPAIALLYATLTSTTISTLRQRQVDIRRSINLEAGELRNLGHMVYVYPEGRVRDMCRTYLLQYVNRLLHECRPTVSDGSDVIDPRKGMDTELNGFLIQLHEGYNDPIPPHLADQSFAAVTRLRECRLGRITALQSTYPLLHWVTLASLAFAACTCFLIETSNDLLYFLQAVQLKLLWSTLIGTFVSCFTVFYDLGSPFAGQYKIAASIDQLYTIKMALKAAVLKPESVALYSGAIADYESARVAAPVDGLDNSKYYPPKAIEATAEETAPS